jgi:hypothetical protein
MGSNNTLTRRRATGAIILAGALALTACGGDDDDSGGDASADAPMATSEDAGDDAGDAGDGGFIATDDSLEARDDAGFDIGIVGRDVIIEMRVVLSSDNIQRTVAAIMADASSLGGGVASSDVNYGNNPAGDQQSGYAVLVVKVPPAAIDRMLAGLDDTGTVQSINQSAQDVTEQLVDLDVRISNARQSVANVREFMDRTENLNELVTLEGELNRRQTELERLEAQQRNLGDRVALSTITIEVVPTAAVPQLDEDEGIGDAFATGWDAFVAFFFGLAFILAVVLPFLALAAVFLGAAWVIIARLGRREPAAPHQIDDDEIENVDPELSDELVTASHED